MATNTTKAERGTHGEAPFDPLLDSFADRYIYPWEERELGRIDSPLYLLPQLEEAAELFDRGRQRWRSLDIESHAALPWPNVPRDFEGEGWNPRNVEAAQEAYRFLLTHTSYDLSKPDEMPLQKLHKWLGGNIPNAVLYSSVAMRCAADVADECYRISRIVEEAAFRWHEVNLAELYVAENDAWYDRIRDVLRELANEVAEAREDTAIYLGAARTALALAKLAETSEALDTAERDYMIFWQAANGLKASTAPSPEAIELAELMAENFKRRKRQRESQERAAQANVTRSQKVNETVGELWAKDQVKFPDSTNTQRCERVASDIPSPYRRGKDDPMSADGVRRIAKKLGLISAGVSRRSSNLGRGSNTEP